MWVCGLRDIGLEKFLADRVNFMAASEIKELIKITEGKKVISLAGGLPDPQTFPRNELIGIIGKILSEKGDKVLQYSPTKGISELRSELFNFLNSREVMARNNDDVIVTTGSQQALHIIALTLINPKDYVVMELPSYLGAINAFKLSEPNFVGVPLDDDGMNVDILEARLRRLYSEGKKVKLVYTIPIAHNPAGVTMSLERRKHLIELADRYDFLIIEDDPYSSFTYEPSDTTSLKSLDKNSRVIYISTLSKILAPGLRIGWILASKEIVDVFERCKQSLDLHTSTFAQYVSLEAIKSGIVKSVIERARTIYKRKKDVMLDALEKYLVPGCWWSKPVGGLFIMLRLPKEEIDTSKMLFEAIDAGVAYVPGGSFYVDGSGVNTMRLNFSFPKEEEISEGIKILSSVVKRHL
ncbi:MAG: PLP-dependent aminotransferase family protein [Sulfolobales archaeon]